MIDGAKATADDRRLVDAGSTRAGNLHLTLPRRNSMVSLIAYNDKGASEPAIVHVKWRGAGTDPKLTLYVLAIGISNYKDKQSSLHFARRTRTILSSWRKRSRVKVSFMKKSSRTRYMEVCGTKKRRETRFLMSSTGSSGPLRTPTTSP